MDAIHVAALFNMIDRLADSLGWDVPSDEAFSARAQAMLESGYVLCDGGGLTCSRTRSSVRRKSERRERSPKPASS